VWVRMLHIVHIVHVCACVSERVVCMRACVRACVRACQRKCARARVCAPTRPVRTHVRAYVPACASIQRHDAHACASV
jgi:hypothetical protein